MKNAQANQAPEDSGMDLSGSYERHAPFTEGYPVAAPAARPAVELAEERPLRRRNFRLDWA